MGKKINLTNFNFLTNHPFPPQKINLHTANLDMHAHYKSRLNYSKKYNKISEMLNVLLMWFNDKSTAVQYTLVDVVNDLDYENCSKIVL